MCVEAWSTPTGSTPDPLYICFSERSTYKKALRSEGVQLLTLAHAQSLCRLVGPCQVPFLALRGCELC